VAVLSAAVKGEVRTFPEGLQHVPGRSRDGGHPRRHGCTTSGCWFWRQTGRTSTPM